MKKVLITGGSGLLGSNIIKYLPLCYEITVIVRNKKKFRYDTKKRISSIIEVKDLFSLSSNQWSKICENIDLVIHTAWYTEPKKYLNSHQNYSCLIGSINLALGAKKAKVKHFIGIGSCLEYDLKNIHLSIQTPLLANNIYASTKISFFYILKKLFSNNNYKFIWARIFYIYGEGESPNKLRSYVKQQIKSNKPVVITNGNQVRDFISAKKASKMIVRLIIKENKGEYNICTGKGISVKNFVEKIAKKSKKKSLIVFKKEKKTNHENNPIIGVCNC